MTTLGESREGSPGQAAEQWAPVDPGTLHDHPDLVAFGLDGQFLFRPVVLRGAGLPIGRALALGDEHYAGLVDAAIRGDGPAPGPGEHRQAGARQLAAVRDEAGRDDFARAIAWQNTPLYRTALQGVAGSAPDAARNSRMRTKERALAKYLTRFAAKNDTIGDVGPACWGELDDDVAFARVVPGPGLSTRPNVYLEHWAGEAIGAVLTGDPALRRWLAPRMSPSVSLDGGQALLTDGPPQWLSKDEAVVLAVCDGVTPAHVLAQRLAADPATELDEAGVYTVLESLQEQRLAFWRLDLPLSQQPLTHLRRLLAGVGDAEALARATAVLDDVERALATLAAAGTATEVDDAFAALERLFEQLTGLPPRRAPGATYGGRQLALFDSRRDISFTIGPELVNRIAPAVGLLVRSLRALVTTTADAYEEVFRSAAVGLEWRAEGRGVSVAQTMAVCAAVLMNVGDRLCDHETRAFVEIWERLLELDSAEHLVELSAAALAEQVEREFPTGESTWTRARAFSADIQLAATDVAALEAGEFTPVIGELHACFVPVDAALWLQGYDEVPRLRDVLTAVQGRDRVNLVPDKTYPRITARTVPALHGPDDVWISLNPDPAPEGASTFSLTELIVDTTDPERLWAHDPKRTIRVPLLETIGLLLAGDLVDVTKHIGRGRPHVPRVVVDGCVVLRETWSLPLAEATALLRGDEATQFRAVRAAALEAGWPRFVFASITGEAKPFLVDLTSIAQVAVLATTVRTCAAAGAADATLRLAEMYPAPDETWVPAPDGGTCTSELRLQLFDLG